MNKAEHNFRVKTYKKPTFCLCCGKLLVGLIRQGLRCESNQSNILNKFNLKKKALNFYTK